MSYYPPLKEDLLPKVQVVYLNDLSTFFAFIATQERGKFLVYDIQKKIVVHKLEMTDIAEDFLWEEEFKYPSSYAIFRVDPDSRVTDRIYKKRPRIIAAF